LVSAKVEFTANPKVDDSKEPQFNVGIKGIESQKEKKDMLQETKIPIVNRGLVLE